MVAGGKRFHGQVADLHAFNFFYRVAGLEETVAQRVAARFGESYFVPGSLFAFQARDLRAGRAREGFDFFEGQQTFQF